MTRKKHHKPEVEEALQYVEKHGRRIEVGGSHAWGRIYCPYNDKDCRCGEFCIASVWSSPRNSENHARQIKRLVDNCKKKTEKITA